MAEQPPTKRARLDSDGDFTTAAAAAADIRAKRSAFLATLSRPVSPPNRLRGASTPSSQAQPTTAVNSIGDLQKKNATETLRRPNDPEECPTLIPSPFQLTRVRGLPSEDNVDTVSLHDILGDPLIKEAWIFNYCFDVDWTMRHFDADIRQLVQVKIVHGSWKREDRNRLGIAEDVKKWAGNVQEIRAYLPDAFGTHHSKMMVLFRHDDTATVVVHTANMIERDWEHMTQAIWRSPVLPLLAHHPPPAVASRDQGEEIIGSGARFKADLLRYLRAYGNGKLNPLVDQIVRYDFSRVRAALVASVPSYATVSDPPHKTWGHLSLRKTLDLLAASHRPSSSSESESESESRPHLVSQVSSIATLPHSYLQKTLYKAASVSPSSASIIYPTPADLRSALTGYTTGSSIHTKLSSAAHRNQVAALRPQLCRWGGSGSFSQETNEKGKEGGKKHAAAGRNLVPPHIKTYILFSREPTTQHPTPDIQWALLTSANLSQQAWGTAPKPKSKPTRPNGVAKRRPGKNDDDGDEDDDGDAVVHVQSYELGVLVWPALFADPARAARMVPVFGCDAPSRSQTQTQSQAGGRTNGSVLVGLRMPYDLPLTPYAPGEMPWSPGERYDVPDRLGRTW